MRNISFAKTTQQVRDRTKTVTRRLGWAWVQPGAVLMACEKCQGIAAGQLVRLGPIRIVSVRREPLSAITAEDVAREGFPGKSPEWFVDMYAEAWAIRATDLVTRIEFEYLDAETAG